MSRKHKARQETSSFVARRNFVDKSPFYRTNDMFNGVFKKSVKLFAGSSSLTDGTIVQVNFNQGRPKKVVEEVREAGNRTIYDLDCGHEFTSAPNITHEIGKDVHCHACGGEEAYRSLEHEWSHIIFKSDAHLWKEFIYQYMEQLRTEGYDVDNLHGISEFLKLVINAFDDIRVTSLWSLVYPGSAWEIEQKWTRLCNEDPRLNENFISWLFGVALDVENLNTQDGPFSDLILTVSEAMEAVKGRGTANMLHAIRWAIDKCVKKLLEKPRPCPPPPPAQSSDEPQSSPSPSPEGEESQDEEHTEGGEEDQGVDEEDLSGGGDPSDMTNPFTGMAKETRSVNPTNKTEALRTLAAGYSQMQADEDHPWPEGESDKTHSITATVHRALSTPTGGDTLQPLDGDDTERAARDAVQSLQAAVQKKDSHQFLLHQANAYITFVKVEPRDVRQGSIVELTPENTQTVDRLRAVFSRVMGRSASRNFQEGATVDVQSLIQYLMNQNEDDVFITENVIKGFGYMTLCDMSGSMYGERFHQVVTASEILKLSLDYPFVRGSMWGFRGASGQKSAPGEVWIYQYDPRCSGYEADRAVGVGPRGGKKDVPVGCGGLTPMNSAIHVGLKYLRTHIPASMAKRMFLLTDGCPNHTSTRGNFLSDKSLQYFVSKEINEARSKGIQVYTIIIGDGIEDKAAKNMFGPKRFWERANDDQTIGQALFSLVVREFVKFLRSR